MKQFLFFILVVGSLTSCAPDNIGRQAVMPASISNTQTPEGQFRVVTSFLLLEDSVQTWTDCYKQRVLQRDSKEGIDTFYDQWSCETPAQWYHMYKGVIITEDESLVEVGFLSKKYLTIYNLEQNGEGTFVKVKARTDIQVSPVPGYELQKVFVYE